MGRRHLRRTGHTGLGGTGGSSPGGGRSLLRGPWGGVVSLEPGSPARGGRGSSPGGGRTILQGWAARPAGPVGRQIPAGVGGGSRVARGRCHCLGVVSTVAVGSGPTSGLGGGGDSCSRGKGAQGKGATVTAPTTGCEGKKVFSPIKGVGPVSLHRASARAGASQIPRGIPSGPSSPAHLDVRHEDPGLESPRWRAQALAVSRPAADAGPWRRAARALPACERGVG